VVLGGPYDQVVEWTSASPSMSNLPLEYRIGKIGLLWQCFTILFHC